MFGPGLLAAHSGLVITSRLPALAALGVAALAVTYVGAVDPNQPGHYPPCPVLEYGGLLCPGCGGLRSVHALVHGEVTSALGANALVVIAVAVGAVCWLVWLVRPRWRLSVPRKALWGLAGLVLVFTFVRNLPVGAALGPL